MESLNNALIAVVSNTLFFFKTANIAPGLWDWNKLMIMVSYELKYTIVDRFILL